MAKKRLPEGSLYALIALYRLSHNQAYGCYQMMAMNNLIRVKTGLKPTEIHAIQIHCSFYNQFPKGKNLNDSASTLIIIHSKVVIYLRDRFYFLVNDLFFNVTDYNNEILDIKSALYARPIGILRSSK